MSKESSRRLSEPGIGVRVRLCKPSRRIRRLVFLLPTRLQEWLRAALQPHRFRSCKPRLGLSRGEIGARMPAPDHLMWVVRAFRANTISYPEG